MTENNNLSLCLNKDYKSGSVYYKFTIPNPIKWSHGLNLDRFGVCLVGDSEINSTMRRT